GPLPLGGDDALLLVPSAALAWVAAGIDAPAIVPVAGLERHEPVLGHVGARSLEAAVPLATRLAAPLQRRHTEPELLDGLDV
ncbi:hypothetical protein, partial [Actinotignum timonense]|uniref:hypothetical protein n=1 Tax=Actinotignum timonense TaxID=1870995 RepID=UPI0025512220